MFRPRPSTSRVSRTGAAVQNPAFAAAASGESVLRVAPVSAPRRSSDIQNVGDHNLGNVAFAARRLVLAGDVRGEAKIGLGTFTYSEAGAVLAPCCL